MSGTPRSRDVTYVDLTFGVAELRDASVGDFLRVLYRFAAW